MNPIRTIWLRLRALGQRTAVKREIDEELSFHLEARTAENIASGMAPEVAAREARKRFGNAQSVREECRKARGTSFGEATWQDIRFGLRMLHKNAGFTCTAVLTLALGIGASTAIYSVVNTMFLNPVPAAEPDRLLEIGQRSHDNKDQPRFGGITTRTLDILRDQPEFFSDVVWIDRLDLEWKTEDFIEEMGGSAVSPNFFTQWNIRPLLGRTFTPAEAARLIGYGQLDRDTVMVLSYSLWRSRFGGQADVLGKTIEANHCRFTIIGVMPPSFQFPAGAYPTCWVPVANSNPEETLGNITMFARLKPGVTAARTQAMLDAVASRLIQDDPAHYADAWHKRGGGFGLQCRPLRDAFTQAPYGAADLRRTLFGLLAAIGFVLLIACSNVANLMLARTERRQQELAIRAAVGAGRMRLMRQLLTESLLVAGGAALAGLAVSYGAMKGLALLIPINMPRLKPIILDGHALAGTLLITVATAIVFGLAPAWLAGRASVRHGLQQTGIGSTSGVGWRRYRGGLVALEVALALVLLSGAGLMIQSVTRLLRVNPGFDADHLLMVDPGLLRNNKHYSDHQEAVADERALFDELSGRFAALPGVTSVGITKIQFFHLGYKVEGREEPVGLMPGGTGVEGSDYFRAMRMPLLAGRLFDRNDLGEESGTVIINDTMARLCWPGENPLGKKFSESRGRVFEVVGVVGNARLYAYNESVEPMFYRPYDEQAMSGGRGPFLVVRTQQDPRSLIPALRREIKAVEPNMTTPNFHIARQTLYEATQGQRTYMLFLALFAGVGLLLAAIGIYGVLAYAVACRTREIGIRMAVGAEPRHVMGMVMGEGLRLTGLGVVGGLLAAFCLTRLLRSQLFEVSPADPGVMIAAVLVLAAVAGLACLLPALRAVRIKPMTALRYE